MSYDFNDKEPIFVEANKHFMGYFKQALPLPSPKALAHQLTLIFRQNGSIQACLHEYYKNDQASALIEAIHLHCQSKEGVRDPHNPIISYTAGDDPNLLYYVFMDSMLSHVTNARLSEMLKKECSSYSLNFCPSICLFLTDYLQPADIHPIPEYRQQFHHLKAQYEQIKLKLQAEGLDIEARKMLETQKLGFDTIFNIGFPMRSFSFSLVMELLQHHEKFKREQELYSCPKLGINGSLLLYGCEKNNDQLLKDFETLCSLPGMDLQAKDKNGQTPLELARSLGMKDAVKIIEEAIIKQESISS